VWLRTIYENTAGSMSVARLNGFFYMVEAAIRKAIAAKHPSRDHTDGELERPVRRRRRGGMQPVPHIGGVDIYGDRDDGGAGQEDDEADGG
jgi:hypothetical protein